MAMTDSTEHIEIRMGMELATAERIAELMPRFPADVRDQVKDQLWLRAIFLEQRRRTVIAERDMFDQRADKILALLDPREPVRRCRECGCLDMCASCSTKTRPAGGSTLTSARHARQAPAMAGSTRRAISPTSSRERNPLTFNRRSPIS